ncbi:VOC family protein [Chengkuizengella axinellae]|uniref:VOC family protein n=1 Tax=Chengkuizengella axinellae TaxID=3064388 RepID=A0ABT9J1Z7_9BACL|nr:VOC family protein [Chengkuizengella sp. 2205SS18-9]MDP5275634.1 VOC family protein [Chengkuizengella sp. 2205SS18-9]
MQNQSPIKNHVGEIFIHVSDMQRAIKFYSDLLGLPLQKTAHEGNIYQIITTGSTGVLLDSHRKDEPNQNNKPILFFDTDHIHNSYDHIKSLNVEIVSEIEVHENISFFTLKDPDGNVLMVNEDKRKINL